MLTLSRMKSLLTVTPIFSKSTAVTPFSLFFQSQPSAFRNTTSISLPFQSRNFLHPTQYLINSHTNCSNPSSFTHGRGLCTEKGISGEIHVFVGPMFAGKTTTLLQRMKLASEQ